MLMNYCPNCRQILLNDKGVTPALCPACDASLADLPPEVRECGSCRHQVTALGHYCPLCGNALSAQAIMEQALGVLMKKP
jgi:predicted RNA-binding Zn-ribbon protein involved in translation (DUF1610 family)